MLFFYLGFLVPILRVHFEFPYVMYQALTIYLLIAIGWHGGEELAHLNPDHIGSIVGFMFVGFLTNTVVGILAYTILRAATRMRRVDQATVAGYYGSDSAGTFVTALGVLATAHIAYDAYMPVMLAVMEIPGCLVALFLVARLRNQGMDALGNMPDEPGYDPDGTARWSIASASPATMPRPSTRRESSPSSRWRSRRWNTLTSTATAEPGQEEAEHHQRQAAPRGLPEHRALPALRRHHHRPDQRPARAGSHPRRRQLLRDAVPGRALPLPARDGHDRLAQAQGPEDGRAGLTSPSACSPRTSSPRSGSWSPTPTPGLTGTHFELGTYVLFSVLCGAASYIAVPAVQRLAIPEASPTLPLAASLGLTFSYNVTIGIPVYMEIAKAVMQGFPRS